LESKAELDSPRRVVEAGFINFGGPTGQIAIMHRALVSGEETLDGAAQ